MRIGEMSKKLGIPVETLRYYDRIGLISPQRQNGIRKYNSEDVQKLSAVLKMKQLMFSLDEIQTILSVDNQVDESIERGSVDIQAVQGLLDQLQTKHQEVTVMEQDIKEVKAQLSTLVNKVETVLRREKSK